jgi:hypothetical protein
VERVAAPEELAESQAVGIARFARGLADDLIAGSGHYDEVAHRKAADLFVQMLSSANSAAITYLSTSPRIDDDQRRAVAVVLTEDPDRYGHLMALRQRTALSYQTKAEGAVGAHPRVRERLWERFREQAAGSRLIARFMADTLGFDPPSGGLGGVTLDPGPGTSDTPSGQAADIPDGGEVAGLGGDAAAGEGTGRVDDQGGEQAHLKVRARQSFAPDPVPAGVVGTKTNARPIASAEVVGLFARGAGNNAREVAQDPVALAGERKRMAYLEGAERGDVANAEALDPHDDRAMGPGAQAMVEVHNYGEELATQKPVTQVQLGMTVAD